MFCYLESIMHSMDKAQVEDELTRLVFLVVFLDKFVQDAGSSDTWIFGNSAKETIEFVKYLLDLILSLRLSTKTEM
jgi:hypothetical protein